MYRKLESQSPLKEPKKQTNPIIEVGLFHLVGIGF